MLRESRLAGIWTRYLPITSPTPYRSATMQPKAKVWPKLSACARSVLAIPATSTSSERTFSLVGSYYQQMQLSPDAVDGLLFLYKLQLLILIHINRLLIQDKELLTWHCMIWQVLHFATDFGCVLNFRSWKFICNKQQWLITLFGWRNYRCSLSSVCSQVNSAFYPPWDGKMSTSQRAVNAGDALWLGSKDRHGVICR